MKNKYLKNIGLLVLLSTIFFVAQKFEKITPLKNFRNEKVLAAIKGMGINVIDMTLADKNELLTRNYYIHELDKHPTGAANLERAKSLISNIVK
jgi:hypothetical protein